MVAFVPKDYAEVWLHSCTVQRGVAIQLKGRDAFKSVLNMKSSSCQSGPSADPRDSPLTSDAVVEPWVYLPVSMTVHLPR